MFLRRPGAPVYRGENEREEGSVRRCAWLVVPILGLMWAGGVVSSGPALATPTCYGKLATILGTPGDDSIRGTPSDDVIVAGGGNDVVRGLSGDDRICGGSGNDTLSGGDGADLVSGGGLDDVIHGGSSGQLSVTAQGKLVGNDRLKGGPGNDTIRAVAGGKDRISCGAGRDHVLKDRTDVVSGDCEVVNGRSR